MKNPRLQLPVVSLGAEYLVMGYLMRRNILTYKAPPNNEGYDLICVNPDPKLSSESIRIQVKSRYQTDCDRGFPVKAKSFDAFDFLVVAFLNIGYFMGKAKKNSVMDGYGEPEYYTLPNEWIRKNHKLSQSGWDKVSTRNQEIDNFKNELGFEMIADALSISYPSKNLPG